MSNLSGLFSKTNLRFFEFLINKHVSVRELAEETNSSAGRASQAVKQFLKKKLVTTKNKKNKKIVYLCRRNPLTRQIISLLFINKIINAKTFKEMRKKAKSIGVYGSVADGTTDKFSDIDLWILTKKMPSMFEIGKMRNKLSKELEKEVSIKPFTEESLKRLEEKDKIFFRELKYKSKILHGEGFG